MSNLLPYEELVLKSYLKLPPRKLLHHEFELSEDYLAGFVSRFLKGERFEKMFEPFSKEELGVVNKCISNNINNDDGIDLLNAKLITKATCNILNKYRL